MHSVTDNHAKMLATLLIFLTGGSLSSAYLNISRGCFYVEKKGILIAGSRSTRSRGRTHSRKPEEGRERPLVAVTETTPVAHGNPHVVILAAVASPMAIWYWSEAVATEPVGTGHEEPRRRRAQPHLPGSRAAHAVTFTE